MPGVSYTRTFCDKLNIPDDTIIVYVSSKAPEETFVIERTFKKQNIDYKLVDVIGNLQTWCKILACLPDEVRKRKTIKVPQFFNGCQYCGGLDEFYTSIAKEKLRKFLKLELDEDSTSTEGAEHESEKSIALQKILNDETETDTKPVTPKPVTPKPNFKLKIEKKVIENPPQKTELTPPSKTFSEEKLSSQSPEIPEQSTSITQSLEPKNDEESAAIENTNQNVFKNFSFLGGSTQPIFSNTKSLTYSRQKDLEKLKTYKKPTFNLNQNFPKRFTLPQLKNDENSGRFNFNGQVYSMCQGCDNCKNGKTHRNVKKFIKPAPVKELNPFMLRKSGYQTY